MGMAASATNTAWAELWKVLLLESDSGIQGKDPLSRFLDSKVPNQFSKSDLHLLIILY